jgi:hypothetical protein
MEKVQCRRCGSFIQKRSLVSHYKTKKCSSSRLPRLSVYHPKNEDEQSIKRRRFLHSLSIDRILHFRAMIISTQLHPQETKWTSSIHTTFHPYIKMMVNTVMSLGNYHKHFRKLHTDLMYIILEFYVKSIMKKITKVSNQEGFISTLEWNKL